MTQSSGSVYPNKVSVQNSRQKKCYICQYILLSPHAQYPSLCKPCGEYNLASSALSLPANLRLHGKTALVTGGRVNLGYHTALRLLRCGAQVIVSTRYPHDAETRYSAEPDFIAWAQRLKIVGADFRAASDVFHLVKVVKECLMEWNNAKTPKLDILINNAAQTLTDSLEKEDQAVKRESTLRVEASKTQNLLTEGYTARIRGGVKTSTSLASRQQQTLSYGTSHNDNRETTQTREALEISQGATKPLDTSPSSWLQSIHQIPYEDVISAHSVNTFVPLILLREFLPIMSSETGTSKIETTASKASSHIINVSSREGIFESNPKSASKNGKHVHTNLTKAALNMLTETEAGPAWKHGKVAINSVDPGFMSAAPEVEKQWKEKEGDSWTCPIGWEDGAGRVLWPIAVSESGKGAVWGRFLKHFGAVEIDVGIGRWKW